MVRKVLFTGFIAALFVLVAASAWAARGTVKDINMPQNHGKIDRTDDGSNNEYQFQIPQGLADPDYAVQEGHTVDFVTLHERSRRASNVSQVVDDPDVVELCPPGTTSGCPTVLFSGGNVLILDSQVDTIVLTPAEWNVLVDKVFSLELPTLP